MKTYMKGKANKGAALPIVLIFLTVFVVLATGMVVVAVLNTQGAGAVHREVSVNYAVESVLHASVLRMLSEFDDPSLFTDWFEGDNLNGRSPQEAMDAVRNTVLGRVYNTVVDDIYDSLSSSVNNNGNGTLLNNERVFLVDNTMFLLNLDFRDDPTQVPNPDDRGLRVYAYPEGMVNSVIAWVDHFYLTLTAYNLNEDNSAGVHMASTIRVDTGLEVIPGGGGGWVPSGAPAIMFRDEVDRDGRDLGFGLYARDAHTALYYYNKYVSYLEKRIANVNTWLPGLGVNESGFAGLPATSSGPNINNANVRATTVRHQWTGSGDLILGDNSPDLRVYPNLEFVHNNSSGIRIRGRVYMPQLRGMWASSRITFESGSELIVGLHNPPPVIRAGQLHLAIDGSAPNNNRDGRGPISNGFVRVNNVRFIVSTELLVTFGNNGRLYSNSVFASNNSINLHGVAQSTAAAGSIPQFIATSSHVVPFRINSRIRNLDGYFMMPPSAMDGEEFARMFVGDLVMHTATGTMGIAQNNIVIHGRMVGPARTGTQTWLDWPIMEAIPLSHPVRGTDAGFTDAQIANVFDYEFLPSGSGSTPGGGGPPAQQATVVQIATAVDARVDTAVRPVRRQ